MDGIPSFTESGELLLKGDDGVPPGEHRVIIWKIPENFGPDGSEPECKAYIYYSNVNEVRDINSGLFGPLLVCRSIDNENDILRQQVIIVFAVINERGSWFQTDSKRG